MSGIMQMLAADGGFVFQPVISGAVLNYNLRAAALAAGWNGGSPLRATVTVAATGVVGSASTAAYAFDTGVGFPQGSELTLVNLGRIVGCGGAGGNGQSYAYISTNGGNGGPALRAQAALRIANSGTIGGGGGGGSPGRLAYSTDPDFSWIAPSSGGGGGAGYAVGSGGAAGPDHVAGSAGNGAPGSATAGGAGGASNGYSTGGAGGGLGSAGQTISGNGYSAGAGGAAVVGNVNVTWVAVGTRLGSLT